MSQDNKKRKEVYSPEDLFLVSPSNEGQAIDKIMAGFIIAIILCVLWLFFGNDRHHDAGYEPDFHESEPYQRDSKFDYTTCITTAKIPADEAKKACDRVFKKAVRIV